MATYTDNLDGSSGALLSARSGWSRTVGVDDITLTSGGSGYYMTGGAVAADGTWHTPSSQPSGNDQYVEAYILRGSAGNPFPLGVRCDPSSALGAGYVVGMDSTVRTRLFRRSAAGALTALGSYTHGNSTDQATNKQRLQVVGDQVSVTFMGTTIIGPVTDTNITSGSVAVLTRGGTVTITTATFDDLEWGDVGAGAQTLTPTLFTNTQTFYAPTVTTGAVALTPALFTNTQTFYSPTVALNNAQALTPALFTNTQTFHTPIITRGAVTLAPALLTNTQVFYAPTVSQPGGTQTLTASLFTNTQAFYSPTVANVVPATALTVAGGPWVFEISVSGTVRGTGLTVTGGEWA